MKHLKSLSKLGVVVAGICFSIASVRAEGPDLPDGPGKDIVQQNCAACHGLDLITAKRRSPDGWSDVLNRMVASGAQLDDAQYGEVLAYLKANLGTTAASGPAPASGNVASKTPASRTPASVN